MEIDFGGGRKIKIRELSRYLPSCDGNGVRMSLWYEGAEYWCESLVEPGKSLREARERGTKAIEDAVRAGTPGKVDLAPKPKVYERTTLHVPFKGNRNEEDADA